MRELNTYHREPLIEEEVHICFLLLLSLSLIALPGRDSRRMAFCDSHLFRVDDLGIARHKREGESYAERLIDGVPLDTTIQWDSEQLCYIIDPDDKEEIVGSRNVSQEIQEVTKNPGKEKGEGKFYRKRRIPKKKNKNYPTKPKPKHSWHKRLSKVAQDLGDINEHTEERADMMMNEAYEEKALRDEIKKEAEDEKNLYLWQEVREKNPGAYCVVELRTPLNERGQEVFDIDLAGVDRTVTYRSHSFWSEWWDKNKDEEGNIKYIMPQNVRKKYFFTYWDINDEKYKWVPIGSGIHPDRPIYLNATGIPPNLPIKNSILENWVDIFQWSSIGPEYQGIRWNDVWRIMDRVRTGKDREFIYYEGQIASYIESVPFIAFEGDKSYDKENERLESYKRPSMGRIGRNFYDTYDHDDFSRDYYSGY